VTTYLPSESRLSSQTLDAGALNVLEQSVSGACVGKSNTKVRGATVFYKGLHVYVY